MHLVLGLVSSRRRIHCLHSATCCITSVNTVVGTGWHGGWAGAMEGHPFHLLHVSAGCGTNSGPSSLLAGKAIS